MQDVLLCHKHVPKAKALLLDKAEQEGVKNNKTGALAHAAPLFHPNPVELRSGRPNSGAT